jgi:hypothetical protein
MPPAGGGPAEAWRQFGLRCWLGLVAFPSFVAIRLGAYSSGTIGLPSLVELRLKYSVNLSIYYTSTSFEGVGNCSNARDADRRSRAFCVSNC